jgi:phosphoesterase RecJ-like protein
VTPAHANDLFRRLVQEHRSFVLVTHVNPDGDAIGSEVGLARFLMARGSAVRIVNQDPTPKNLAYLEEDGPRAEAYDPAVHDAAFESADLIVLLDNSAPDRLGRVEPVASRHVAKSLCIDHHPTQGTPWNWNLIDDQASATAVLVYRFVRALGWTPDRAAAAALYAGLATDTGFFRFSSARPEAHLVAADLLSFGADPARCYAEVYERNAPEYTRLLGHALASLELHAGGAIASVRITRAAIAAAGADGVDTSEITTPVLGTEGVRIVLLFRELAGGRVKVSLRSKGALDVHGLATEFGGGGHRNASGIVMTAALDDALAQILSRAEGLLRGSAS